MDVQVSAARENASTNVTVRFRAEHDLEMLVIVMGKPTIFQRGSANAWEEVAETMRKTFPELGPVSGRTCQDRTLREVKFFSANDNKCRRRSGTEEQFTQKDELLTELAVRLRDAETAKTTSTQAKKDKATEEQRAGAELREAALLDLR